MSDCLGLFAKYWEPGKVKTRLAATVGPEKAAEAYRHFLSTLLNRFADSHAQRWLSFAPSERREDFRKFAPEGWELDPQAEGDLGDRIRAFFSRRFDEGFRRVVVVGSDSPHLPLGSIRQAFEQLQESEVVLGPTEDGGYWLVGASGGVPDIFGGIPWSTPRVWQATLDALQVTGTRHSVIPVCYDVDQEGDLKRLVADLKSNFGSDPQLDRLHELLSKIFPEKGLIG